MEIEKLKAKKSIKELLEFGIIIFDKPENCTSFDVVDFVRRKLRLRKASHFGTLDPMVTGVLPLALNRAVKLTGFFIGEDKEYTGTMRMHDDVSIDEINKVIEKKFIGKIIQMPPVRSSVKRQEREREIKKFKLLEKNGKDISFIVECQGGTYIRKLVHDLGEEMGIGAHMIALRRIRAGIFKESESVTKEEFEIAVDEYERGKEEKLRKIILPAEVITKVYPVVKVKKEFVEKILHGAPIDEKFLIKKEKVERGKVICIFNDEKFIGMYKVINEGTIFARAEFVLQ
ncbi:MAG: RNA-guided pseudouridylation complex pseudouridine synthase subunit Cbf5 [Candidatus Nanoarchaeia archaeon]|nr:RNA-guided pseudouridylation complex pseudouridine synthase subunit Cbf5 [Candidatus Nanoarchaeia archaeon]MDD5357598.1 RNA-guided pseudouridylation complex pseudouridine synthase subunit Cbf5 [Candidatus Nanoarchaeia archaeon]MDD5588517.1 RNA-guided pseudouridylation complex pseudouridine synthase subunit Cbf5 [Candidatus Nanoarchaeia archaeon]